MDTTSTLAAIPSAHSLLDALNSIGLGVFLGSFLTTVIQHLFERQRLKSERMSDLNKEIYFKLQNQAEKIFSEINLMYAQTQEISHWLSSHVFTTQLTNMSKLERLQTMSEVTVYFSEDTLREYDKCADAFRDIADLYADVGKKGELTKTQTDVLPELLNKFEKGYEECKKKVRQELVEAKQSINSL